MFAFMLDELPAVEKQPVQLVDSLTSTPLPVCIHNCGHPQADKGYLMSSRKQTYICPNCIDHFNRLVAHDRKASGRE